MLAVACLSAGGCKLQITTKPMARSAPPSRSATLYPPSATFGQQLSSAFADVLRPIVILGAGIAAYRAKEGRWPTSLDEVSGLADLEENWRNELSTLSDVVIEPQPDDLFFVKGAISRPPPGTRPSLPTTAQFTATISMRASPNSATGWEPQVDAKIVEPTPETTHARP